MIDNKLKIAVYMYGQVRTGLYCAPRIKKTFESIDGTTMSIFSKAEEMSYQFIETKTVQAEIDYFLDIKTFNTYANTVGVDSTSIHTVADSEIKELIDIYQPTGYEIVNYEDDFKFLFHNSDSGSSKNSYSTMFSSLNRCANMKKQYEVDTGTKYDYCALHRYDTVLGPQNDELSKFFLRHGYKPMTIYTGGSLYRWHWENNKLGSNDLFIIGDSFAIDLMLSDLTRMYSTGHREFELSNSNYGPNISINDSIQNCSIRLVTDVELMSAIVRQNADLTKSIFDNESWQYHHNFWLTNHSSNNL